MRGWLGTLIVLPGVVIFSVPCEADFLLNCRLMNPDAVPIYRQHCKWQTVVIRKCRVEEACAIRMQNFRSVYARNGVTLDAKVALQVASSFGTIGSPTGVALSSASTTRDLASGGGISVGGVVTSVAGIVGRLTVQN
jgi:hypothetical protein